MDPLEAQRPGGSVALSGRLLLESSEGSPANRDALDAGKRAGRASAAPDASEGRNSKGKPYIEHAEENVKVVGPSGAGLGPPSKGNPSDYLRLDRDSGRPIRRSRPSVEPWASMDGERCPTRGPNTAPEGGERRGPAGPNDRQVEKLRSRLISKLLTRRWSRGYGSWSAPAPPDRRHPCRLVAVPGPALRGDGSPSPVRLRSKGMGERPTVRVK